MHWSTLPHVCVLTLSNMLKTINLFRFSLQCCRKCRNLINRVSTSAIVSKRENISEIKLKFLEGERKKYEDTFGDIEVFERKFSKVQEDPEDIAEYERLKQAKGKTLSEYKKEISELLTKHQYEEAIRVLEIDMVNDKIKSDIGIYRMLLNYTAKQGNLDEAYRLYIRYRKRQGRMTGPMYTSLFNACANSKNSLSALKKAETIRENLAEDQFHKVNIFNYNSMLKAFGRHGDVATCLKIFDEVLHKRLKAFTYTYNFLLQSCISDKNAGLRHALIVWRKMIQSRRKPDIWFFNLFLRCVRDCSLGDVTLIPDLLQQINQESGKFFKKKLVIKKIGDKIKKKVINVPADGTKFLMSLESDNSKNVKENLKSSSDELEEIEMVECNQSNSEIELQMSFTDISKPQITANELKNEFYDFEASQQKQEVENVEEKSECYNLESQQNKQKEIEEKEKDKNEFLELELQQNEKDREVEVEKLNEFNELCEKKKEEIEVKGEEEQEDIEVLNPISLESEESDDNHYIFPDLLALNPSTGSVVEFGDMTKPHNRIMLFGGVTGFLETMSKYKVVPDVRTMSLLLDVSSPTEEAEQKIIELAKTYRIKLDAPFFSVLIKRRIFRGQSDLIQNSLKEMQKANVQPDLICFGVLSFGCDTYEMGMELLENLKLYGYRANSEILYALLYKAERAKDFVYVKAILDKAKADDVELSSKFIAKLGKIVDSEARKRRKKVEEVSEN